MSSLQLQALIVCLVGCATTFVSARKMWRNHERRRGVTLARWFGLSAGIIIAVTYGILSFNGDGLPPGQGRSVVIMTSIALLLYTVAE